VPRYVYKCAECDKTSTVFHLFHETVKKCDQCGSEGALSKMLTRFRTSIEPDHKTHIGKVTEDFIKTSRVELQQQKEKLEKDR